MLGLDFKTNPFLADLELFSNQLTKRIFDLWMPWNWRIPILSWIPINVVLPSAALQIAPSLPQFLNEFFAFQAGIPNSSVLTVQRGLGTLFSLSIIW
jgi:hypothetical protein